jgi:hypothetical protein
MLPLESTTVKDRLCPGFSDTYRRVSPHEDGAEVEDFATDWQVGVGSAKSDETACRLARGPRWQGLWRS